MPQIDLTHVVQSPVLSDRFTVTRRSETINDHGESVVTTTTSSAVGVITAASPSDLQRLDDQDRMHNSIAVVTTFRLQGPSPGVKADVIEFGGVQFLVREVNSYTSYGGGFIQAVATSMLSLDPPNG